MAISKDALVFVGVLVAAYAFGSLYNPTPTQEPLAMLRALNRVSNSASENLTFALGYNVCVDAILPWGEVMDAADMSSVQASDRAFLSTSEDVHAAFRHYFSGGAAAERSCDAKVFAGLVAKADVAQSVRRSLGGNAALMARKLALVAPTSRVVLNGHIGPAASALLPAAIRPATPISATDEVHLILEYSKGDGIVGTNDVAPRANRFIITADLSNQNSDAMLLTIEAADAASADVLVVAGLHMLEPLPAATRVESLSRIAAALASRTRRYSVHVELASTADQGFMRDIAATLFQQADSLGFNEQEAAFLYEALDGTYGAGVSQPQDRAQIASHTNISSAAVATMLRFVLEAYPSLSRLHYHSLPYHILAYRSDAVKVRWRGNAGAVAAGAVAATTEACQAGVGNLTATQISFISALTVATGDPRATLFVTAPNAPTGTSWALSSASPVAKWTWNSTVGDLAFFLAPVPVCNKPVSTVGLGDAISAAGIATDTVNFDVGHSPESSLEHTWPGLKLLRKGVDAVKGLVQQYLPRKT